MPLKVFISYRRQDTAASAIGIGQYLEKEFGRKNVYIDIDMQAGTKYPAAIEKSLAECTVLLVLIGPNWLRLQKPNDWVQLEIAFALKRNITVIPVLIDGAQLPDKEALPDDIQGLLDHQAASVTLAGFRHEMAGLVRDIRSIRTPKTWRLLGAIAAALILSVTGGIFGFYNLTERSRPPASSPELVANGVWKSRNGEWVLYAVDSSPAAHFFKPSSIKSFGDRVAYTKRFALNPSSEARSYQDEVEVLNCKRSVFAQVERTIYNSAGQVIYHFKSAEPESSDFSGQTIWPTDVVAISQRIMCDEGLRALLLSKARLGNEHLSYLANSPDGDRSFFHGSVKPTSDPAYPIDVFVVIKSNNDHPFADVFPGQNVRGLPPSYRTIAGNVQINCKAKNLFSLADEYYDKEDHLVYLAAQTPGGRIIDAKDGSTFGGLLNVFCGARASDVEGTYEGMNYIDYGTKGEAQQKIAVTVQQNGSDLEVSFETANGAQGEESWSRKSERGDKWSFCLTAGTLCPANQERP
jgi:hypothetical protein